MYVLGTIVRDHASVQQKMHASFVLQYGTAFSTWGGTAGRDMKEWGSQTRHLNESTLDLACGKVVSLRDEKIAKGYRCEIPVTETEIPDGTPVAMVLRKFVESIEGGATNPGTAAQEVAAFLENVADAKAPKKSAAAAMGVAADRVDERVGLRLDPTEVVYRPNGERYYPRDLGGHTDIAAIRATRDMRIYPILEGKPGTGKTALSDAACPDLIALGCHGDMTTAHLLGTHLPTHDGGWEWRDGPLTQAMREGRVLLLDEINAMPNEVSAVLHSALDGRRVVRLDDRPDVELVTAVEGFHVIGTYNPDSLGNSGLSEAITSRFTLPITVTTDYTAARTMGCPPQLVQAAENLTTQSRQSIANGGPEIWAPQMRELLSAKRLIDAGFGLTFAASALLSQCPHPEDLPTITDALHRATGRTDITPLTLGAQQ